MKQRQRVMAVLWSEFLALWFERTHRRAVPLLLATLLLLFPSLPALPDCSCEMSGEHHPGMSFHHEEHEVHQHKHLRGQAALASSVFAPAHHVHLVAGSKTMVSRAGMACCSCAHIPPTAAVAAAPISSSVHADSESLTYMSASVLPVFRVDVLSGLFGRAGPASEANTKPQILFLASLAGRAPPVSL